MAQRRKNGRIRIRLKTGRYYDYNLIAAVVILVCFGLVMLYSASSYEATGTFGNDMYYLRRQLLFAVGGLILAIAVSRIDYHYLISISMPIYITSLILMLAVKFTPLGYTINGARRWLRIPGTSITFQPSEIAKIAVILFLAYMIKRMGRDIRSVGSMFILFAVGGVTALSAYLFTENLSTAIIIMGICAGMVFVAHPKTTIFVVLFIIVVAGVAALTIYLIRNYENFDSFRATRVLTWLDPEKYSEMGGWQVLQGLYAIGSGGFFGKGLGNSTQKLDIIPESGNDMIFSIICEELGLFGAIFVLILFAYLLYRLAVIAQNAADRQGSLIAAGILVHISLQVILNVCVVLNVIPTTGITLPFISYGGTSILFLMMEIGLALGVSDKISPDAGKVYAMEKKTAAQNRKNGRKRSSRRAKSVVDKSVH